MRTQRGQYLIPSHVVEPSRVIRRIPPAPLETQEPPAHTTRMTAAYLNPRTGETYPLDQPRWCGPGHAPLLLTPLPGLTRDQIDTPTRSLWRYRAALPFQPAEPITMGEGCTPLIRNTLHGARVLLKCEWMMPTG